MSFIEKTQVMIEITRGVYNTLVYLSEETGLSIKQMIEDFVTDAANDLATKFYEIDKQARKEQM